MRLDAEPDFLHAGVADASPTSMMYRRCITDASPIHRRCIADVSAMRRHPPTPYTPTPSRRPLRVGPRHKIGEGAL
eukprot:19969-Pyramimonas_sp.AAC.1